MICLLRGNRAGVRSEAEDCAEHQAAGENYGLYPLYAGNIAGTAGNRQYIATVSDVFAEC